MSGFSPGQVIERGGELIDTTHTTMRGYAREFGLTLENITRTSGEIAYFFDGRLWPESAVVDEFRVFVDAMRADLRALGSPTARSFTAADRALDLTNLRAYLDSRGAGPLLKQVIDVVYNIEYGVEIEEQSAVAFLLFIHADRRSRFKPFGVFSDEKFHIVEGNQRVAIELARRLTSGVQHGLSLVRVARTAAGRVELTLQQGRRTVTRTHDRVVLTLPFSVLRQVELDSSLGLSPEKLRAINELRYGTNAKMMLGFNGRPWLALGSNGSSYSDLANHQATWETSPTTASATAAVLTDYSSGRRGASLDPSRVQFEAERFLADLGRVYPGIGSSVRRDSRGQIVAHLEHWPSNPYSKGSYTANQPGYFTTIADLEAEAAGNVHFAGEHTSSFYEWQGFMEGAALSGLRAAAEVYAAVR
jgi:monoamine oxidase